MRRVVTRPVMEGGEQHETVTDEEFERRVRDGEFALHWHAHGLRYGLPAVGYDLKQGRVVVANLSRVMIAEAAALFPVRVVEITAPADIRAARLVARGREDRVDVARRLARSIALPLPREREVIVNDGTVAEGAAQLVRLLNHAAERAQPR